MRPSFPFSSVAVVVVVVAVVLLVVAGQTAAQLACFSLSLSLSLDSDLISSAESRRLWWPNFLLLLIPLSFGRSRAATGCARF